MQLLRFVGGIVAATALVGCSGVSSKDRFVTTVKPPPREIATLGQMNSESLPVTRRARSWYSRVQRPLFSAYRVCHYESDEQCMGPLFAQPPHHLVPVDDGHGVYFAVDQGHFDHIYHYTDALAMSVVGGPVMKVLSMIDTPDGVVVLGLSDEHLAAHLIASGSDTMRDLQCRVPVGSLGNRSLHLIPTPGGFSFEYPTPNTGEWLVRRVEQGVATDARLFGPITELTAVQSGAQLFLYSIREGDGALFVTEASNTDPVSLDGNAVEGCARVVVGDQGAIASRLGNVPHDVLLLERHQARVMPFSGSDASRTITSIAAGATFWALASDVRGIYVHRWNGTTFELHGRVAAQASGLLTPHNDGVVHAEPGGWVIHTWDDESLAAGKVAAGEIWNLWVDEGTVYLVARSGTSSTLYSW